MLLEKICKFSMCTSCRRYGGPAPKKNENQECREVISCHFAKSQIYLNYAYLQLFQRRMSPFIFFSLKCLFEAIMSWQICI